MTSANTTHQTKPESRLAPSFRVVEALNRTFSSVGDHTFFDADHFPWVEQVEAATPDIQEELNEVLQTDQLPNFQHVSSAQHALTTDDKWKTYFLYGSGHTVERNCARCPRTVRALQSIPGLKTAMFSVLSPNKHIPPHRGPYNGVLRYHLPLQVPGDGTQCGIRVGSDTRYWREGRSMIFDDSYDHEAWNATEETRVVLFVDFVRPLPWPVRALNDRYVQRMAASDFVVSGIRNVEAWNRHVDRKKSLIHSLYKTAPQTRS